MKKLFLDVDGVLAHWNKGAHQVLGLSFVSEFDWRWTRGRKGWDWYERDLGLTTDEVFAKMPRDFWANLEWHSDGNIILQLCEHFFEDNICILSAPGNGKVDGVIDGRLDWIKKHLPKYAKKSLIGYYKEACASEGAVLIDDFDDNIERWEQHGGIGILVPRPWNSLEYLTFFAANAVAHRLKTIFRKENHA